MAILMLARMFIRTMRYHIKWWLLFWEVLITGGSLLVCILAVQLSGIIAMSFANAQIETSPWRFWLLPVIAVPLWLLIILLGFYTWTLVLKRLIGKTSVSDEQNPQNHNGI